MTALTLLGLLPHGARTAGSARFDGVDLLTCSPAQLRNIRGRQIAMVSQDPATSLHPILTVERQLTEHMRHHLGVSKSEARSRAVDLLATVRIPDPEQALGAYPGQFSADAPAHCHRRRPGLRAPAPAGRRADDGTGRHCAGRHSSSAGTTSAGAGTGGGDHHPRSRRDVRVGRPGLRDVWGTDGRVGSALGNPAHSRHPYTRGLLDSLPHPEGGAAELRPIAGSPPSLGNVPPGCPFHPRCPYAQPSCSVDRPELITIGAGHRLACPVDPLAPVVSGGVA